MVALYSYYSANNYIIPYRKLKYKDTISIIR